MPENVRGDPATLVIENAYQWVGSAGLGAFVVYVDGKRAGVATLGSQLRVRVDPGQHTVRVRLWWWYRSPTVRLTVGPGETRRLSADIPRQQMVLARIVRGIFDPFRSLSLEEVRRT
ncbi:MAG TPA: hypothetical protein VME44_17290 [Streptosporangiaceae bacterium]|nr:hypothetical protein [Streptosporangiaceae bacterium]